MQHTWISEATRQHADALLAQMTLEEKAALTIGHDFWSTRAIERLGIPSIWLADGPHGVRKAPTGHEPGIGNSLPATCFPTASALASSWNVELAHEVGSALGVESQAQGVQVLLGPGMNLKRSPLGGRNFEYFSEDPVLSGEMGAALVNGVQSQGVGTTIKHYVANEQETGRMYVSSEVDEQSLRELYLRPFEIAVAKGRPWSIMAAYNAVNGAFATESTYLLRDVLKDEWGYPGIVISDWDAISDRIAALKAGLHLQMPGVPTEANVVRAVRVGHLDEARLDAVVRELLHFILTADASRRAGVTFDKEAHHHLARRAAGESIVLLKNDGDLLPLAGERLARIAVIGALAKAPRYQGSGSSQVVTTRVENAYDELVRLAGDQAQITYATGYDAEDAPSPARIAEARAAAAQASVAVVFIGLPPRYESEGFDRPHIDLPPAHNALVEAVLAVQQNVVVVLSNGSAVAMPWAGRVPAIVEGWLSGQASGGAVADVLLGRVNPSGKLSETFPVKLSDTPAYLEYPGTGRRARYGEGLFTGYRWYDTREIAPLFPFGHGLSYTTFVYSNLTVDKLRFTENEPLTVACNVKNTGSRAGQEVVQLYVRNRTSVVRRPDKELRAFAKVALEPGEEQEVRFQLAPRDFASYDAQQHAWAPWVGEIEILLAASSRDIRLRQRVFLESTRRSFPVLDRLTTLREWRENPVGRPRLEPLIAALLRAMASTGEHVPESAQMLEEFILDMPIVKLVARGVMSWEALEQLIAEANMR